MGVLLPNVTSVAAVGIIFTLLFARDFGLVNWLLGHVGVDPFGWQDHKWSSWLAISVMVDWRWTGYNALIFLAALQAVPKDLYESAAIDGASSWRQFWQSPSRCCGPRSSSPPGLHHRRHPALHRAADLQQRRQRDHRGHDAAVPDADDVPLREGVHRPAVRLRLDRRLGDVPGHRAGRCLNCCSSDDSGRSTEVARPGDPDEHREAGGWPRPSAGRRFRLARRADPDRHADLRVPALLHGGDGLPGQRGHRLPAATAAARRRPSDNVRRVLGNPDVTFGYAVVNSVAVSVVGTVPVVLISCMAGFAFAKLRFRGRRAAAPGHLAP